MLSIIFNIKFTVGIYLEFFVEIKVAFIDIWHNDIKKSKAIKNKC